MGQEGFSSQAKALNSYLKEMNKLVKRILKRVRGPDRGNSQFKSPGARLCVPGRETAAGSSREEEGDRGKKVRVEGCCVGSCGSQ